MGTFLLIETRTAWESSEVGGFLDLAEQLARDNHAVDLYLVQNAVLMAKDARISAIAGRPNIHVWVDDFSMKQRAMAPNDVSAPLAIAGVTALVDMMTRDGCKPIWHG